MRKQIVRIVSVDKRYQKEPYPFIPIYNERIGNYITGQHLDASNPATKGRFTKSELENPETISMEKRAKFPYIIFPEYRYPLSHLRSFDLSVDEVGDPINQKDHAEFEFFKLQDNVAPSKDDVRAGVHYFYIENLEAEAENRLSKRNLRFEAEKLIREKANFSKIKEVALVLNYRLKDFRVNINASEQIITDEVYTACEKYPQDVIRCFSEESMTEIFILKAEFNNIITRRGSSFFDGSQYLGDSIDDVKKYLKTEEGQRYERRWKTQLAKIENISPYQEKKENDSERFESLIEKCSKAILLGDTDNAEKLYQEAFLLDAANPILVKIKESLTPKNNNDSEKPEPELTEEQLREKFQGKNRNSLAATCRVYKIAPEEYQDKTDEEVVELLVKYLLERK
jgi:hypothetical protein